MNVQTAKFYVDGTAALAADETYVSRPSAHIVKFPAHAAKMPSSISLRSRLQNITAAVAHAVRYALDTSEMYCSLKFEDFRGCAYHMFSRRSLTLFAIVSTVISALSIAVGA